MSELPFPFQADTPAAAPVAKQYTAPDGYRVWQLKRQMYRKGVLHDVDEIVVLPVGEYPSSGSIAVDGGPQDCPSVPSLTDILRRRAEEETQKNVIVVKLDLGAQGGPGPSVQVAEQTIPLANLDDEQSRVVATALAKLEQSRRKKTATKAQPDKAQPIAEASAVAPVAQALLPDDAGTRDSDSSPLGD